MHEELRGRKGRCLDLKRDRASWTLGKKSGYQRLGKRMRAKYPLSRSRDSLRIRNRGGIAHGTTELGSPGQAEAHSYSRDWLATGRFHNHRRNRIHGGRHRSLRLCGRYRFELQGLAVGGRARAARIDVITLWRRGFAPATGCVPGGGENSSHR